MANIKDERKEEMKEEPETKTEFQELIPSLTNEEYDKLEASLIVEGCRDALVTWKGIVLDGHNRLRICHEHSIPFNTVTLTDIESEEDAKVWIIRNQMARRNLTPAERSRLAAKLKEIETELAKGRQLAGLKHGDKKPVKEHVPEREKGQARDKAGEKAGVSGKSVDAAEKVETFGSEKLKEALHDGVVSLTPAAEIAQHLSKEEQDKAVAIGKKGVTAASKKSKEARGAARGPTREPRGQFNHYMRMIDAANECKVILKAVKGLRPDQQRLSKVVNAFGAVRDSAAAIVKSLTR